MVWHLTTYVMMLLWLLMSMVIILGAQAIWIYMYRNTPKNYANVVSHIKELCYGMTCPMRYNNPIHLMHLKVIIVSTLDEDSPHTMSFVFVILHVPCFKPTHVISLKCLYILCIYVCISSILRLVFYSPVCIWYNVGIQLFYIIAMILSNCCIYHVDVKTIVLHAYC